MHASASTVFVKKVPSKLELIKLEISREYH
jgi:hypothetical protein